MVFRDKNIWTKGTSERVYWHYGYLTAVRDTLQTLIPEERQSPPR